MPSQPPLSDAAVAEAAGRLAALRLPPAPGAARPGPVEDLPEGCRPASLNDAYRVQAALRARLAPALGAPAGWKIGCTSPVMQAYLGVPHPCMGTLFAGGLHRGAARLRAADFHRLGLECEIAVRLAAPIPAGAAPDAVAAAVGEVMCSVEIVEERFADFSKVGAASLTADDFFSCGCVLGEGRPLSALPDLASLVGGFRIDGAAPEVTGTGAAILGHPLSALAWLAELRAAQGAPLAAGEAATLGSVVRTIYPRAGQRIEASFDGLPGVTVEVI